MAKLLSSIGLILRSALSKPVISSLKSAISIPFFALALIEAKKDQASKVLIIGGKNEGFVENIKIKVELVEDIEGRKLKTQIGQLKITKINGDFSEANVVNGGLDIMKNFNNNQQIVCTVID